MSNSIKKFEISLAIAGGGCKALYGLGVGFMLRKWGLRIKELSGVSAGSAIAMMILSKREEEGIEYFEELLRRNDSNFRPFQLLKGKRPWPHENMYKRTLQYSIDFNKIIHTKVKIFIHSVKAFPRKKKLINYWNKLRLIPRTMRAVILDEKDLISGKAPTRVKKIIEEWNFQDVLFTNKDFKSENFIEHLIMISSSIPPVVRFQKMDEEYYFDGGLTNNLLLEPFSPNRKKIGVYYEKATILTKSKESLKNTYLINPESVLPITTFDYTNSDGARAAYELGKIDAEKHKDRLYDFLGSKYE